MNSHSSVTPWFCEIEWEIDEKVLEILMSKCYEFFWIFNLYFGGKAIMFPI